MTTLHLIRESSAQRDFSSYINLVSPNDSIILLDDGCYNAITQWLLDLNVANIYIIDVHATARAIKPQHRIKLIASESLVDLVCQHDNSITWN